MYEPVKRVVWSDWAEQYVTQQRWHPMRVAMLYRLGPKIGAKRFAKMFGLHPVTVSRKAGHLGIALPRSWKGYAPEELAFIRRNAQRLTYKEMAVKLGRTESGIRSIAFANGIGVGTPKGEHHPSCRATDHEVELARQLHEVGLTERAIAEKLEVSQSTVHRWVTYKMRQELSQ